MKCLTIVSAILLMSIGYTSSDKLQEMCDVFKPSGVFGGIKAYTSFERYGIQATPQIGGPNYDTVITLYGKGVEWQMKIMPGMALLSDETFTLIRPKLGSRWDPNWNQDWDQLVISKTATYGRSWSLFFLTNTFIIRTKPIKIWYDLSPVTLKDVTKGYDFSSDSFIAFNPTPDFNIEVQTLALIDRKNPSKDIFYSFEKNEIRGSANCWPNVKCVWPEFHSDLPMYWRERLDAILDLTKDVSNPQNNWLLLFNNNSKPLFCILGKDKKFAEGCKDRNIREYGEECPNRIQEPIVCTTPQALVCPTQKPVVCPTQKPVVCPTQPQIICQTQDPIDCSNDCPLDCQTNPPFVSQSSTEETSLDTTEQNITTNATICPKRESCNSPVIIGIIGSGLICVMIGLLVGMAIERCCHRKSSNKSADMSSSN